MRNCYLVGLNDLDGAQTYVQDVQAKYMNDLISIGVAGTLYIMAFQVVEFSSQGYKIRKVFGKKSTVFKWNYQILRIGVMASYKKLGIILVINGFQNWFIKK